MEIGSGTMGSQLLLKTHQNKNVASKLVFHTSQCKPYQRTRPCGYMPAKNIGDDYSLLPEAVPQLAWCFVLTCSNKQGFSGIKGARTC
jgi:hypothetical protein